MTERIDTDAAVRRWMDGYLTAWTSNEPDDIRALFTPDAEYRTEPWSSPMQGVDQIVAGWVERKDEPDTFAFAWDVAGIDGSRAFVQAQTDYRDGRTYSNLWVIDLDDTGRARSFTEWWMDQSSPS